MSDQQTNNQHFDLFKQAIKTLRVVPILKLIDILPNTPSENLKSDGCQALTPVAFAIRNAAHRDIASTILSYGISRADTDQKLLDTVAIGENGLGSEILSIVHMLLLSKLSDSGVESYRKSIGKRNYVDDALSRIWGGGITSHMQSDIAYINTLLDKGASFAPGCGWCQNNPFSALNTVSVDGLKDYKTSGQEIQRLISRLTSAGADINHRYGDEKMGWLAPLDKLLLRIDSITLSDEESAAATDLVVTLIAAGAKTSNGNILEFVREQCPRKGDLLAPAITHAVISHEVGQAKSNLPAKSTEKPLDDVSSLKKRKITVY